MPGALVAADPAARIVAYLSAHPTLTAVLGGPGRVGAHNAPPYPRLVVTDGPGGTIRPTRWLVDTEYQLEVLGDPDGRHGKAVLRALMFTVQDALSALPTATRPAGDPVITAVEFFGSGGYSPTGTGQKRYVSTCTVTAHPGVATD